jgi:hypothetical protein
LNVLVKCFVDEVVIVAGSEIIARHGRIYGRDQFVFDPKHYPCRPHAAPLTAIA